MICPDCKQRMSCINTFNEKEKMRTARCYRCECGKTLYTMETVVDILEASYVLAGRQKGRKR